MRRQQLPWSPAPKGESHGRAPQSSAGPDLSQWLIAFNNKNSTADWFVRDCSAEGAKIAVAETLPLPREFDFLITGKRENRRARLVWRHGAQAGVTFLA